MKERQEVLTRETLSLSFKLHDKTIRDKSCVNHESQARDSCQTESNGNVNDVEDSSQLSSCTSQDNDVEDMQHR